MFLEILAAGVILVWLFGSDENRARINAVFGKLGILGILLVLLAVVSGVVLITGLWVRDFLSENIDDILLGLLSIGAIAIVAIPVARFLFDRKGKKEKTETQ